MKQFIITTLMLALPLATFAQTEISDTATVQTETSANDNAAVQAPVQPTLKIAVFSLSSVMDAIPEVQKIHNDIEALRKQYAEELKRAEDDFNDKYESFLEAQAKLAPAIRNKRQAELQELLERNMTFKQESQQQLRKAEHEAIKPIKEKINRILTAIARQNGYNMVLNIDRDTCPYIDNVMVVDITSEIQKQARR